MNDSRFSATRKTTTQAANREFRHGATEFCTARRRVAALCLLRTSASSAPSAIIASVFFTSSLVIVCLPVEQPIGATFEVQVKKIDEATRTKAREEAAQEWPKRQAKILQAARAAWSPRGLF